MTIASSIQEPIHESVIPGIPDNRVRQLIDLLTAQPEVSGLWLFGSRAIGTPIVCNCWKIWMACCCPGGWIWFYSISSMQTCKTMCGG